jgi:hypothetical protein
VSDRHRDFVRLENRFADVVLPREKLSHLTRPSRSGASSHGLRTLCGLGQRHLVWRITIEGAARNVNGDGWAVCAACCQRAAELRLLPALNRFNAP